MSGTGFAQLALTIKEYAWLAPLVPIVWLVHRSRLARTAARITRVAAWDWLLRLKGVPASIRHELITEAARRDLESS